MVVWLRDWPEDRRVAGSFSESTDFLTTYWRTGKCCVTYLLTHLLTNGSGKATNALVSLFTKWSKLVPAS